ncbi:MAG: transcription-repair coupling factor [Xanthomonadales bacterium]|nr:transcription-repair coupling factor [Xanthomonadales bacterium]
MNTNGLNSPLGARFADGSSAWTGLHGSSTALALLSAARAHDGIVLVVTRSTHQSHLLEQDIRLFSDGSLPVLHFPDHETLPYDPFSPHPDIIAERLATLSSLAEIKSGLLLVPVSTLLQRLPPRSHALGRNIQLKTGQSLVINDFRERLQQAGYSHSDPVYQAGQFAVRGSVIDLFPSGRKTPLRIDLFDEEIDSLKEFDPETQRSTGSLTDFDMLPAREYPCDTVSFEDFRKAFRYRFVVDTRNVSLYQDVRQGLHPQGLEQYLPLFFEQTEGLLDYLPVKPLVVIQQGVDEAAVDFWASVTERWEQRRHDIERPVLDPLELYYDAEELQKQLKQFNSVSLLDKARRGLQATRFETGEAPDLHIHDRGQEPAAALLKFSTEFPGRVMFAADTTGRREVLSETLWAFGIRPVRFETWTEFQASDERIGLSVLPVETAFVAGFDFAILTESQLFGGRVRIKTTRKRSERDPESIIRSLSDLELGNPVVHEDHGVGRYRGLQMLQIDGREAEFLMLEYANEDKLYVPVSSMHLISRYTGGAADTAPLHRLGSEQWGKARKRAAQKVRDVAAELLDLYARRQARQGFEFEFDKPMYADFSSGFPYEETADQQTAINAVLEDMVSSQPMDRVVCGDVGFGKTEVALRAAYVAVQGQKQVAILVPTTLLAQQHFSTFSDRFADWPIRIELLSRFRTGKQTNAALKDLADGKVDIVIGTHKLLQRDVKFKRLGLVIVDEEQRFGVRQKERLKQLRAEVDLLTLTATPIPRTLNMAMAGIRDLSIIATPPARRMAVKTLVSKWDSALLREALQREIQRGGQAFFLHNEVRNIEQVAREVGELVPAARIRVAHGQMARGELQKVMLDFYRQRINVLVCTTIIENGIDVPTANTIIINRADKFGLAQLHQLRGRVGRSHHRAYAYLVTPDERSMTRDARKRLEAIASLEELGAGFTLATHDLEIRGAGELLGDEQSGEIQSVGFSLYSELLARAVSALRTGKEVDLEGSLHQETDIELHISALIPDDWIGDIHTRLTLYKRIASATDTEALRELQVEMIDRFGLLPQATKYLFQVAELRQKARAIGVRRVDFGENGGHIEFNEDTTADPVALLEMIQRHPFDYKLQGPHKLRLTFDEESVEERMRITAEILDKLSP